MFTHSKAGWPERTGGVLIYARTQTYAKYGFMDSRRPVTVGFSGILEFFPHISESKYRLRC